MTPGEAAAAICNRWIFPDNNSLGTVSDAHKAIVKAITEAGEEEREAAAQVADGAARGRQENIETYEKTSDPAGRVVQAMRSARNEAECIAAAIRARKDGQ